MKAMKLMTAAALAAGVSFPAWGAHATKDEAIAMVNKAVAYFKQVGPEKAYAAFDNKEGGFKAGELYILVYGMDGHVLAHGANVKLIGKDMNDAQDVDGKYYVKERIALAGKEKTFWQDYKFVNPVSKKIEPKQAYCERVDQSIICSGIYKQ
ncbi:MAG TPA: cache domain-containing protein [Pseudolabrys sp.]|nr:cache domain-containing protein [Pseudolabrys sp.]